MIKLLSNDGLDPVVRRCRQLENIVLGGCSKLTDAVLCPVT